MSIVRSEVSKSDVIPTIESAVFDSTPDARFAIGVLALGDVPTVGLEAEYRSYYDLRKQVYVDETGQLSDDDVAEDGTDRDADDARSVAFGVLENNGAGQVRAVGALRLIMKGYGKDHDTQRKLPVEDFCPEVFVAPAPSGATEVSRLIARHENARMQQIITGSIYSAGLAYIANHDLGPTYAVIEPWLERYFKSAIPAVERIGEPRYIEHYQDENLPIEVHTDQFIADMERQKPGSVVRLRAMEGRLTYFGHIAASKLTAVSEKA